MSEVNFSRRGSLTSLSTTGSGNKKDASSSIIRNISTEQLFQMEERFVRTAPKKVPNGLSATPQKATTSDGFHKTYGGTYYFPNGEVFRPRLTPTKRNRPPKMQSKSLPGSRSNSLTNQTYHYIPQSPSSISTSSRSSPAVPVLSLSADASPIPRSSSFNNVKNRNKQDLAKNIRSQKRVPNMALNWDGISTANPNHSTSKLQSSNLLKSLSLLSLSDEHTKSSDSNHSSFSNCNRSSSNTPTTSINTNEESGDNNTEVKSNNSTGDENLSTLNEVSEENITRKLVDASPAISDDIFKTPVSSPCIPDSQTVREELQNSNRQSIYHDAESIYNDIEESPSPSFHSPRYEGNYSTISSNSLEQAVGTPPVLITKENSFAIDDVTSESMKSRNEIGEKEGTHEEPESGMPTPNIDKEDMEVNFINNQKEQIEMNQSDKSSIYSDDSVRQEQYTASSPSPSPSPEASKNLKDDHSGTTDLLKSQNKGDDMVLQTSDKFNENSKFDEDAPMRDFQDVTNNKSVSSEKVVSEDKSASNEMGIINDANNLKRKRDSDGQNISPELDANQNQDIREKSTQGSDGVISKVEVEEGNMESDAKASRADSETKPEAKNHKRWASSLSSYGSIIDSKFGLNEAKNSIEEKASNIGDNNSTNANSSFSVTSGPSTSNSSPIKSSNKDVNSEQSRKFGLYNKSFRKAQSNNSSSSPSRKSEKRIKNSTSISNLKSMYRNIFSHSKAKEEDNSIVLSDAASRSDMKSVNSVSSFSKFKRTFSLNNLTAPMSLSHSNKKKLDSYNPSFSNSQLLEKEEVPPVADNDGFDELKLTKLPSIEKDDNLFDDMFNEVDQKLTQEEEVIEQQKIADKKMALPFLQDDELTKDQIIDQQLKDGVLEVEFEPTETTNEQDDVYIDDNIRYLQKELTWFDSEAQELKPKSIQKDKSSGPKNSVSSDSDGKMYIVDNNRLSDVFGNINEYQKRSLPDHFKYIEQFKDYNQLEIRVQKFKDVSNNRQETKKQVSTPPILKREHSESPNKKVLFSNKIFINETFSPDMYKRYNKSVTQYTLTEASQIIRIKDELNQYKCKEMLVHELSQQNTQFFY